jgi:hypothetical protein
VCGVDEDCDGEIEEEIEEGIGDTDCNDRDDCRRPDEAVRVPNDDVAEPNVPESAVGDYLDPDDDGDGLDDGTERAQNHNSSRSNRTSPVAVDWIDPDGDTDQSEVVWQGGRFESTDNQNEDTEPDNASDWVRCWGRAVDSSGTDHAWGGGLCVGTESTDDDEAEASRDRIAALQVRGEEVRAWSEAERTAWRSFQASEVEAQPELKLAGHVIERTLENERIIEMRITDDEPSEDVVVNYQPIEVSYKNELRLFGFIPMEREVQASISADGETTIDYPWYRFLSAAPEHDRINTLLQDTLNLVIGS